MYNAPTSTSLRSDDTRNMIRGYGGMSDVFLFFLRANALAVDFLGNLDWLPSTVETLKLDLKCREGMDEAVEVQDIYRELSARCANIFDTYPMRMQVPHTVKHIVLKKLHGSYELYPKGVATLQVDGDGDVRSFDNIVEYTLKWEWNLNVM